MIISNSTNMRISTRGSLVGTGAFNPASLFFGSEGLLLDMSRIGTLAQDSAGETPVTAAGQPVGRVLDQSGGARHATQSTSAARPTLGRHPRSGRRNLLTWTEDMSNAAWFKNGHATISADGSLGGVPAVKISDGNTTDWSSVAEALTGLGVGPFTLQIRVKKRLDATTMLSVRFGINDGSTTRYCGVHINPNTGVIDDAGGGWTYRRTGFGVSDGGDHWLLWVSADVRSGDTLTFFDVLPAHFSLAGSGAASNIGDNTVAAPQVKRGSGPTAYQRVTTASDVVEAGQQDLWYLSFDGVDDWLTTASMALAAGGRTVIAALQKRSAAGVGTVVETGPDWSAAAGAINLIAPSMPATANYGSRTRPAASPSNLDSPASFAPPHTAVLSLRLAAGSHVLRVNGAAVASGAPADAVSALTAAINIGARSGGSRFGALNLYGLIVIDRALNDFEMARAEAWAAAKCGVVL